MKSPQVHLGSFHCRALCPADLSTRQPAPSDWHRMAEWSCHGILPSQPPPPPISVICRASDISSWDQGTQPPVTDKPGERAIIWLGDIAQEVYGAVKHQSSHPTAFSTIVEGRGSVSTALLCHVEHSSNSV